MSGAKVDSTSRKVGPSGALAEKGPRVSRPQKVGSRGSSGHTWIQLFRGLGTRGHSLAKAPLGPTFRKVESTFASDPYVVACVPSPIPTDSIGLFAIHFQVTSPRIGRRKSKNNAGDLPFVTLVGCAGPGRPRNNDSEPRTIAPSHHRIASPSQLHGSAATLVCTGPRNPGKINVHAAGTRSMSGLGSRPAPGITVDLRDFATVVKKSGFRFVEDLLWGRSSRAALA